MAKARRLIHETIKMSSQEKTYDDRIAISAAAFEAIAATLPLGSVGYEAQTDARGERLVWIEAAAVDKLRALRRDGESYPDVILRLVEIEAEGLTRLAPVSIS